MPQLDLSEFRPIPNHPSYLIAADGRVATLKKHPVALLKPQGSTYGGGIWLRITLDRYTYRLRDLVRLIWGSTLAFTEALPTPEPRDGDFEEVAW